MKLICYKIPAINRSKLEDRLGVTVDLEYEGRAIPAVYQLGVPPAVVHLPSGGIVCRVTDERGDYQKQAEVAFAELKKRVSPKKFFDVLGSAEVINQ